MYYILVLLILSGCSELTPPEVTLEPSLLPYRQIYVDACNQHLGGCNVDRISLKLESIPTDNILGRCQEYIFQNQSYPTVTINSRYFASLSQGSKEALFMHEYGHCHLKRGHLDNKIELGSFYTSSSLMAPILISGNVYIAYRDYYLTELFGR
jgi:hypothetical protein